MPKPDRLLSGATSRAWCHRPLRVPSVPNGPPPETITVFHVKHATPARDPVPFHVKYPSKRFHVKPVLA